MATANELIAHPRTFMRNHILMVQGGTGGTGGLKTFGFSRANSLAGANMRNHGAAMEVYVLKLGQAAAENVQAFWCPYSANDFLGTTLPGAGGSNLMFTYAMDGCTLVAGSVGHDNSVVVHHVNMSNAAGALGPGASDQQKAEQQRRLQRNIARSLVANPSLVDPDDYYDPARAAVPIPLGAKISTVTFGRRSSSGAWKFYTHQWYTVVGDRTTLRFIGTQRVI